ncbi:hypothetical protein PF004_g27637 [Phytophthora fragariae]|uniref:PX domain-containing protein n=1 Tax=Phytophthora fragariae TaxID=53985 RepID=A0A6G0MKS3_9STRA|nr:hypothetical protein PF004_g27637 [Phytophthora fragariae]
MGCSQSKANDVVIEPITAPPSECGKASMDLAFTEIIVDDHEETSMSAPPPPVKEELEVEVEEVEAPAEPVPVDEQVEVPVQSEVAPLEDFSSSDSESEEEEDDDEKEEEEEEAPVEPEVEAEDEVELQQQQEKSAVVEKSVATTSVAAPVWTFAVDKVAFSIGVAFFHVTGSNGEDEVVHLAKRYSEFKALHADMAKLMDQDELPGMPGTSFLQGRNDKALLQERETAFVKMLNAIAVHPEASQSAAFTAFLA